MYRSYYIPLRMMPGIRRYIEDGIMPGDFLTAIFENDLVHSMGLADDENLENIPAYASYLYNEVPQSCWGSKKIVKDWIASKENAMKKKKKRRER